jgi:hypothetical protein
MSRYTLRLEGDGAKGVSVEYPTVDQARNGAIRFLGAYLSEHPEYASAGHWRVNVEDEFGRDLLHVIVATVQTRSRS